MTAEMRPLRSGSTVMSSVMDSNTWTDRGQGGVRFWPDEWHHQRQGSWKDRDIAGDQGKMACVGKQSAPVRP